MIHFFIFIILGLLCCALGAYFVLRTEEALERGRRYADKRLWHLLSFGKEADEFVYRAGGVFLLLLGATCFGVAIWIIAD